MHEMQTIVTDVHGVCQSVCPSRGSARLHCAWVIRCSLCQITLASCCHCLRQKHAKYVESGLKALKARNEYVLCLEAANAAVQKYFSDDIHDLINVRIMNL